MSSDAIPNSAPEPTEARFSMRSLFVVTAIVAVVAALLGLIVRRFEPEEQFRLLSVWAVWLLASLAWIGYLAKRRRDAERLAGHTLLRLPMFDERLPNPTQHRRIANGIGASLLLLMFLYFWSTFVIAASAGSTAIDVFTFIFMGAGSIWWLTRIVLPIWWRNSIRVCERGLLWDRTVIRWDRVIDHHLDKFDRQTLVVSGLDQNELESVVRLQCMPSQLIQVQTLLAAKTSTPSIPPGTQLYDYAHVPLSIAVRDSQFRKHIGGAALGSVAFIWFFILQSYWPTNPDFHNSILIGIFGSGFVSFRWFFRKEPNRMPLVRLVGERKWPAFVGFGTLAAVCYYLGYSDPWSAVWPAIAMGIGFGAFAMFALAGLGRQQFELRDDGVAKIGASPWPWSKLRLAQWDISSGKLVLAYGWRRVEAVVPSEQRAAVDKVLREKLTERRASE